MKIKQAVSFVLSLILSAALLWWLSGQVSFQDLRTTLQNIYRPALWLFFILHLTGSILRAWRYKILLVPRRISWGNILMVTFIRNLFVDLLPARLGSLSYVYILNQRLRFRFESAASSFVLSFLLDFLTLSPLLVLSVLLVGFGSAVISGTALLAISFVFFLLIFIIFWQLIPLTQWIYHIFQRFLKMLGQKNRKWAAAVSEKLRITILELKNIRKRKIYWGLFFLSLAIRLAKYGSAFILLFALLRQHGFALQIDSFFKTILGITGAELTSVLPIKGIGGFGTWESAWALTLRLMNFSPELAVISGIGIHFISNFFEYFLGIISLLILYLPIRRFRRRQNR